MHTIISKIITPTAAFEMMVKLGKVFITGCTEDDTLVSKHVAV
jgi:hypothetical protein